MDELAVCDFCGEEKAVLYCEADASKLCLCCDNEVHSANSLSKRHFRAQLCDACRNERASIRCCTDDILLCKECDHRHAAAKHERQAADEFDGCPSAIQLACKFGLDKALSEKDELPGVGARDIVDKTINSYAYDDDDLLDCARCGKNKQVIYQQLLQLLKQEENTECRGKVQDGAISDSRPPTSTKQQTLHQRYGVNQGQTGMDPLQDQAGYSELQCIQETFETTQHINSTTTQMTQKTRYLTEAKFGDGLLWLCHGEKQSTGFLSMSAQPSKSSEDQKAVSGYNMGVKFVDCNDLFGNSHKNSLSPSCDIEALEFSSRWQPKSPSSLHFASKDIPKLSKDVPSFHDLDGFGSLIMPDQASSPKDRCQPPVHLPCLQPPTDVDAWNNSLLLDTD
ncbi:hypothetical protein KI387_042500 [Taxus chinensis]|uniref:B box-type domain-containing protein n=1 Tax=Taxus chinensis TaxID=29808 RepID=A0AA38F4Y0_TAXCH|nr:hypothetical protein KI387_042500 [Taxus chinensis]